MSTYLPFLDFDSSLKSLLLIEMVFCFLFSQTVRCLQYWPEEYYQRKCYFFSISICVCVCVSVCIHMCGAQRSVLLYHWLPVFLRQCLLLNLQLADSVNLAGQGVSVVPVVRLKVHAIMTRFLHDSKDGTQILRRGKLFRDEPSPKP